MRRSAPRVVVVHVHLTGGADAETLAALPAHYFEITIVFISREWGPEIATALAE